MMATALLALGLAAASPVQVFGNSQCPTAGEVSAVLSELLPPTDNAEADIAWVDAAGLDLQVELRSISGEVRFSRRLISSGTCADLATIAAVVIASWTSERHAEISLLQPGVPAPPAPALSSSPMAPAVAKAVTVAPQPTVARTRDLDLAAGLGSVVNSSGFVGAARLEAGVRGRRWGLRAGFAAETARSQAVATATTTVSWRRYALSLGPTVGVIENPVRIDVRAEVFAGMTTAAGHGFTPDRQSSAVAPGLALATRMGTGNGWIRPFMEVGAQYWLAHQQIAISKDPPPNPAALALPSWEARLFAGVSLVLSR